MILTTFMIFRIALVFYVVLVLIYGVLIGIHDWYQTEAEKLSYRQKLSVMCDYQSVDADVEVQSMDMVSFF